MCHTRPMKKTLLFVPLLMALVSCGTLSTGFQSGLISSGFANSADRSNHQYSSIEYTYYAGDNVDTSNTNVAHFTFNSSEGYSLINKDQLAPLVTCDNSEIEYEIKDVNCAGVKANVGFFLGIDSSYLDGSLTILSSKAVKGVVVRARKYYALTNSWNEDNIAIDEEVAIAINSTKYIKLTSETNESGIPNISECRFNALDRNQIEIKVGPQRALIEEIAFYF